MPPAGNRFGPQVLAGGPFSHLQQSHLQHHTSQHQPPGSAGLPPPSFSSHHAFGQANLNSNLSPFAPSSTTNGLAGGFGTGGGLGGGGTGLASREAMVGFAHGAALQQQQARDALRRSSGGAAMGKHQMKGRIRDVWRHNLAQEMQILRALVEKYPYISMVCAIEHSRAQRSCLTFCCRTQNFLELWHDPWAPLPPKPTITTKHFAVMSISSESFNLESPFSPKRAKCRLLIPPTSLPWPLRPTKIVSCPVHARGNSTSNSPPTKTCTITIRLLS